MNAEASCYKTGVANLVKDTVQGIISNSLNKLFRRFATRLNKLFRILPMFEDVVTISDNVILNG